MFCELQLVHDTGYILPQPTLEERWHQVITSLRVYFTFSLFSRYNI